MGVIATFRIGFNWFNVSSSRLHFPLPPLFFGFFVKKADRDDHFLPGTYTDTALRLLPLVLSANVAL